MDNPNRQTDTSNYQSTDPAYQILNVEVFSALVFHLYRDWKITGRRPLDTDIEMIARLCYASCEIAVDLWREEETQRPSRRERIFSRQTRVA